MIPDNARIPRITAAAGTELADAYSAGTLKTPRMAPIAPRQKRFNARRAHTRTRHGWIRIPSIVQYPSLLPPVGVWAVSQSQCGARHHRHGGPLPRRPANATRANPAPPKLWREGDAPLPLHGVLVSVSRGCPPVRGMSLTRYAPFRRSPARTIAGPPAAPRLACVRPAASVHPEPGSNSSLYNSDFRLLSLHRPGTKNPGRRGPDLPAPLGLPSSDSMNFPRSAEEAPRPPSRTGLQR